MPRRTVAPVKHLKMYRDRHGTLRLYHRPTGTAIKAVYGSPEFFLELERLNGRKVRATEIRQGTLSAVMTAYKKAPAFADKAAATRAGYEKYYRLWAPLHDQPVGVITTPMLAAIRDKLAVKHGRRTANYALAVMSVLLKFAKERGLVKTNAVQGLARVRSKPDAVRANRPWASQECRVVIERAPGQIKTPLALAMFTGMRKRDALTIGPQALAEDGFLTFLTSKTREPVRVPLHPILAGILDARSHPEAKTLATTSRGEAWSESGFDSVWGRFKADLEKEGVIAPGLTIHGLRHTIGGMLADADCDLDTIRRALGQRTLHMAQLYSERAKRRRAQVAAGAKIDPFGVDEMPKILGPPMDS